MDIINYFTRIRCPKIVKPSKLEHYYGNNQVWWSNKFKELEAGIRVPPYRKLSELRKVFSEAEINDLKLAGLEYEDDVHERRRRKKGPIYKIKRRTYRSSVYIPTRRCSFVKCKPTFADSVMTFCKNPKEEVNKWSPSHSWFFLNLTPCMRRATALENRTASNFEQYFRPSKTDDYFNKLSVFHVDTIEKMLTFHFEEYLSKLDTKTQTKIVKDTILSLFEITCTLPITYAILIDTQEILSVPNVVARYLGNKTLGTSDVLEREINRDLLVAFSPPITHAFGTGLPVRLRRYRTSTNNAMNWIKQEKHCKLKTFAAVFEGILDLESTRGFVLWLRNHREIRPPEYLRRTCYFIKSAKKFYFLQRNYKSSAKSKCNTSSNSGTDSGVNIMI